MKILNEFLVWLLSGDSAGIATILTALIAWFVYKSQVRLRDKEAVIILLNEIKHAENSLQIIINSGFDVQNESISILTTCSWDKNYQIFTRYLSANDFKLLSDFFNICKAAQLELEQWRRYIVVAREEKAKEIQRKLLELAYNFKDEEEYQKTKKQMIDKANEEDFIFSFNKPQKYFEKYINSIPQISGTTIFTSLNKLSKIK
ncbi:MAG: hypothetical protein NTU76_04560 [Candidatus Taylorbacteria bacterium]|nr:hypothetical protein [Candidatus Taylorbacteria bacterium]